MATTQQEIREWLERGKREHAAFMLVVCDTFDWKDYPVYIKTKAELAPKAKSMHAPNMQKVMECYDLSIDFEQQLNEGRSWHGWSPPDRWEP
jgi:hypothetical protein